AGRDLLEHELRHVGVLLQMLEEGAYGLLDPVEGAARLAHGRDHSLPQGRQHALEHRLVQPVLGPEVVRDRAEVRARLVGDVAHGERFGVGGPDGAGKTTTLRMLAGVLRPSDGDALVGGFSVAREPERVKHRIAYMSQRFGLYTDLTVAENIDFYADLYRVP